MLLVILLYISFLGCMYMPVCTQDSLADQPRIWAEGTSCWKIKSTTTTTTHPTILCWLHWELLYTVYLSAILQIHRQQKLCGPLGWHRPKPDPNNSLPASSRHWNNFSQSSPLYTYCRCPLRSYSSFRLASTTAAKTTSWTFLPCKSQGIYLL